MAVIAVVLALLCLKPVTDRMPEQMKLAFSNVRETALMVASGEGVGMPNIRLPRARMGQFVRRRRRKCRRAVAVAHFAIESVIGFSAWKSSAPVER